MSKEPTFKSKLLEKLGATKAAVFESGPSAKKLGVTLALTLATVMSVATPGKAMADEPGFWTGFKNGIEVTAGISDQEPSPADVSPLRQAMGSVGNVLFSSAAGPVAMTLVAGSEIKDTYEYVTQREEIQTKAKLAEVSARLEAIKLTEIAKIRQAERDARSAQPQEVRDADQKRMMALVDAAFDGNEMPEELVTRYATEEGIAQRGGETEPFYKYYNDRYDNQSNPDYAKNAEAAAQALATDAEMADDAPQVNSTQHPDAMTQLILDGKLDNQPSTHPDAMTRLILDGMLDNPRMGTYDAETMRQLMQESTANKYDKDAGLGL